jgi:uncharacterized protein (TIGR02646 family)
MIWIERPAAPGFLADAKKRWQKETIKAIAHYTSGTAKKAFKFEAYNDSQLKEELKKVFVKCAYCESNYGAVSDGDVEHFRPKGKVNEKNPQTPGYYWLANDWDNLLLSCQHCNQRRNHILYGETSLEASGKLDQFPLSDETKRVNNHGATLEEEEKVRLLLNPCKDKPEDHFEYDKEKALIIALTKKGKVSVEVYALRRPLLVRERQERLNILFQQMDVVKSELERFNKDKSVKQKSRFDTQLDILLNTFTKRESPYAGMCRYFVKKFLRENDIK